MKRLLLPLIIKTSENMPKFAMVFDQSANMISNGWIPKDEAEFLVIATNTYQHNKKIVDVVESINISAIQQALSFARPHMDGEDFRHHRKKLNELAAVREDRIAQRRKGGEVELGMNYTICYQHRIKGVVFGGKAISLDDAIFLCRYMQRVYPILEHSLVLIEERY